MRESSYNFSKQNSQLPKDIRGGEKKVMKKSLSTILALAMTFSVFSSVALAADETSANDTSADAAKSSADFSDLKDLDAATKAKFDALIAAGVFDGVGDGKFGVKDEMNRAQFAKVAALIFNLKVDTSLKSSSFSDVKSDDPANGYALPYIEAVKAAGITDGYGDGVYNPAGKVTKEQLATFLIRGLGKDKDAKATPGVTDSTVTDWAKGYVALALQLKLLSNGTDGKFGGQTNATRDLLVLGSYEAKSQYKPVFNGKYAIASFKATDADLLQLQLNGVLTDDAAKNLKVEIKKDGNVVSNYTTTWNDAKDTATFKFDTKFQNNEYSIAISGVSNIDDANKTAKVSTTVERIAKIEFLTAADTLPRTTNKLRIDFKATNQYGAKSSLSYNNFTINAGSNISVTGISGEQAFYLKQAEDTKVAATNRTSDDSYFTRNDRISVTVIHEDSGVTANKVFAVGESPNVAKLELGELKSASDTKLDAIEANKDTYLDIKAYDQYGIPVEDYDTLHKGVTFYSSEGNVTRVSPDKNGNNNASWFTQNSEIGTGDSSDLKFKYNKIESKDNITLTLIANGSGQTVTKTVKVLAPKTPATVEFGNYNYTLAEGDTPTGDSALDQKMYVPIIVKDSKGDQLSADDIAANAYKFTVYATGAVNLGSTTVQQNSTTISTAIVQTGEHKGQIAIASTSTKGSGGITIQLVDASNVRAQWSTNVAEKRRADKIAFSTTPNKYMINNTDNEFKVKIYDQNGGELKTAPTGQDIRVRFKLSSNDTTNNNLGLTVSSKDIAAAGIKPDLSERATNQALVTTNPAALIAPKFVLAPTGAPIGFRNPVNQKDGNGKDILDANGQPTVDTTKPQAQSVTKAVYTQTFDYSRNDGSYVSDTAEGHNFDIKEVFDKSFKFYTTANATLDKAYTFTAYLETKDTSGNWNSISNVNTNLTVLDSTQSTNKLTYETYAADSLNNTLIAATDYLGEDKTKAVSAATTSQATYVYTNYKKFTKEIKLRAKNNSGETVSVPNGNIKTISSSNPQVVEVVPGQRFIAGLKAGTAKITVAYIDAKGDYNTGSFDVTVKNEAPSVTSIGFEKSSNTISRTVLDDMITYGDLFVWDTNMGKKLTVKDQFGGSYVSDRTPLIQSGGNWYGTLKDDNSTTTISVASSSTDQFIQPHASALGLTFYVTDVVATGANNIVTVNNSTGQITAVGSHVTDFTLNVFSASGKSATVSVHVN